MMAMLIQMMAVIKNVWWKQAGDAHLLVLDHQAVVELKVVETDFMSQADNNIAMTGTKILTMVVSGVEYNLVGNALQFVIEEASAIIDVEME